MALSLNRLMPVHYAKQIKHEWGATVARFELFGSTALLLGAGCLPLK
jgi:phosphoglycerate dehydrogenase-like enzyme